MFAVSSIVFMARSNNSLAIVDMFNIDMVRMLDTMSNHSATTTSALCVYLDFSQLAVSQSKWGF